jgi:hypothetical protein
MADVKSHPLPGGPWTLNNLLHWPSQAGPSITTYVADLDFFSGPRILHLALDITSCGARPQGSNLPTLCLAYAAARSSLSRQL